MADDAQRVTRSQLRNVSLPGPPTQDRRSCCPLVRHPGGSAPSSGCGHSPHRHHWSEPDETRRIRLDEEPHRDLPLGVVCERRYAAVTAASRPRHEEREIGRSAPRAGPAPEQRPRHRRAVVTISDLSSSSEAEKETRVFDGLRSRVTCLDAGRHSAQCVSTHNPRVVGSSPTRPTTSLLPAEQDRGRHPAQRSYSGASSPFATGHHTSRGSCRYLQSLLEDWRRHLGAKNRRTSTRELQYGSATAAAGHPTDTLERGCRLRPPRFAATRAAVRLPWPTAPTRAGGLLGRRTRRPARATRGQHPSPRTLAVSAVRWISEEATLLDLVSSVNRSTGSTVSSTQKYPGSDTSLRSKNCPQRLQS
jgi:hypothetical protein